MGVKYRANANEPWRELDVLRGPKGDKGDKGDTGATGAQGEPGKDGQDGKDYVLTDNDRAEIAEQAAGLVEIPESGGIEVTGASVGQTIVVKAVDENGKPTEWEAADLPVGGGDKPWRVLYDVTTTEDVSSIECTIEPVKEIFVMLHAKMTSDSINNKYHIITINGKNVAETTALFNNNIRAFGFQFQYTGAAAFGIAFEGGAKTVSDSRTSIYKANYLISTITDAVATNVRVRNDWGENKYEAGARFIVMGR